MTRMGVHPDIAGFQDLAHAFDLKASALAARATLEAALERRGRGCRNRSTTPSSTSPLQVNLVWSGPGSVEREQIPPIPDEFRPSCGTSPPTANWSSEEFLQTVKRIAYAVTGG